MAEVLDISSNQTSMILTAFVKGAPIPMQMEYFDTEGEILSVSELETADAVITPDGKTLHWGKNQLVEVTIKIAPSIPLFKLLSSALSLQSRMGQRHSVIHAYSLLVNNQMGATVFSEGTLVKGTVSPTIGNDKIQWTTFTFKFGNVTPLPTI